jgi:hypothetical protein
MVSSESVAKANENFYKDMIDTVTEKLFLSEINEIAYDILSMYHIIIEQKFINGIDDLWEKVQSAIWPKSNLALETAICSSAMRALKFSKLFSKRSGPLPIPNNNTFKK